MNREEINSRLDEERLAIETHQQRIKELEEQLKPKHKAWDFGLDGEDLRLYASFETEDKDCWSAKQPGYPNKYVRNDEVKVLGNLKDIVKSGPIVIGLSVEDVKTLLKMYPKPKWNSSFGRMISRLIEALERYERNS